MMENNKINPWDLRTDDTRKEDTLCTFIIFCEDSVCETSYFRSFIDLPYVNVGVIGGQKAGFENVINAIAYCKANELFSSDETIDSNSGLSVWCVFDRDIEETEDTKKDISFDESIKTAASHNVKVAWSNDCFELWVLLHFTEIDKNFTGRNDYYDFLTNYFKGIDLNKDRLIRALSHPSFCYKKDLKHLNNFNEIVLPLLKNEKLMNIAIKRAEAIDKRYHDDNLPPHSMNPCTKVYLLVQALLKAKY